MTRRKILFTMVAVGCLLAVTALVLHARWTRKAPLDRKLTFQLREGSSKVYRWSMITNVAPGGRGAPRETSFQGYLNLRMLSRPAGMTAAVQLSSLRVRHDDRPDPKMEKAFSRPFLLAVGERGEFAEALFSRDLAVEDRGVLDAAVRSFQVVFPEQPSEQWQTAETDQNGEFVAAYQREPESGVISKRKLRYASLRRAGVVSIRVLSSSVRAEIDPSGLWLRRSEGTERLQFETEGGQVLARVDATFAIEPSTDVPPADLALWQDEELRATGVGLETPSTLKSAWDEAEQEAQRRRFSQAGVTLDKLVAALSSHSPNDAPFAHQFVLFLQLFPEEARKVGAQTNRLGDKEVALVFNVLQLAGTPEAQSTLAGLAESNAERRANRLRALVAIASLANPTPDTAERLTRLYTNNRGRAQSKEVTAAALLALGTLARAAPDESGKPIIRRLEEDLRSSTSPDDQRLLLRALENAHVVLPADTVRGYLAAENPGLREAAVGMLSADQSGQTADVLLDVLQREKVASVRSAAMKGLLAQPTNERTNIAIARRLLEGSEEVPALRTQMVSYLGRQLRTFPQNRTLLETELKREVDRQVVVAILNSLVK